MLEITESLLMRGADKVIDIMNQLVAMGLALALDDFGTGYSSLSYLKRFPIDVLKIDQSFTFDVTTDESAASITRAIIAMARSLGMTTVAEGVETREQMEFLGALGGDVMQGFLISRPLPEDQITALLNIGSTLAEAQGSRRWPIVGGNAAGEGQQSAVA